MTQAYRDYVKAIYEFDALVKRLGDSDWDLPTPCERWNVAKVVRHLGWDTNMSTEVTRGRPAAIPLSDAGPNAKPLGWIPNYSIAPWVVGSYDGSLFVEGTPRQRQRAWASLRDELLEVMDGCDPHTATFSVWAHETVDTWWGFVFVDYIVHGWDLAQAVGAPVVIDSELAARGLEAYVQMESRRPLRASGAFVAEEKAVSDDPLDQLIGWTGRRPDWRSLAAKSTLIPGSQ